MHDTGTYLMILVSDINFAKMEMFFPKIDRFLCGWYQKFSRNVIEI